MRAVQQRFLRSRLSSSSSSRTMAHAATTDPSKMGEGRAIAVLTSGGDAQGKKDLCVCVCVCVRGRECVKCQG